MGNKTMFENLSTLPADPILGLMTTFHQEKNPEKINLRKKAIQYLSNEF